jgi:ribosomal protein S24E
MKRGVGTVRLIVQENVSHMAAVDVKKKDVRRALEEVLENVKHTVEVFDVHKRAVR